MSRSAGVLAVALALLVAGGTQAAAPGASCHEELASLPISESVTVDVEQLVDGIVEKMGVEPYWSGIRAMETRCEAPAALPGQYLLQPDEGGSSADAKAIQGLRVPGLSGVVFAYQSRGAEESMTGLAAALVEYGENGAPGRVYKASELLGYEGWGRLVKSKLTASSIERCTVEITYARYSPEGDIVGDLQTPIRTHEFCEDVVLLP